MTDLETRLLDPVFQEDDFSSDKIRPSCLRDFVGQNSVCSNLEVFIESAKVRSKTMDHVLFYGPPGLGKTTLAHIISHELGVSCKVASGPAITRAGDLAALITNLKEGDVLFIDEIHRLNASVDETLYSAMEDFVLDIVIGSGVMARSVRVDLPKFTLVGATTRLGLLTSPLRDRFGIPCRLDFYSYDDLIKIIARQARLMNFKVTSDGVSEVAYRSRRTPRIAGRLLRRVMDFAIVNGNGSIDKEIAQFALNRLEIDKNGFDSQDRNYIRCIAEYYAGGPVGIETLCAALSESKDAIEDVIEPFLIQNGIIGKTPRGRVLSKAGWDYLKLAPPEDFSTIQDQLVVLGNENDLES